jgi:hypothetical protein
MLQDAGLEEAKGKKAQPPTADNSVSFARDWRDVALLFAYSISQVAPSAT